MVRYQDLGLKPAMADMSAKRLFDRSIGIQPSWRHISTSSAYPTAVFSALGSMPYG